jgi:hypothetical protein
MVESIGIVRGHGGVVNVEPLDTRLDMILDAA